MSALAPPTPQRAPDSENLSARPSRILQRKCACGGTPISGGECSQCRKKKESALQRHATTPAATPLVAPSIVHDVIGSAGQPLDRQTRAFMEPRFGRDFSQVRVHTDATAARSAEAVSALAYTVGRHVAFGAGKYRPHTEAGRSLLAHELAHTIQQEGAADGVQRLALGENDGAMEREAHTAAHEVMHTGNASVRLRSSGHRVQGFSVTNEAAGGCGICYDVGFPGKGPQNAGRVAHTVIQTAFKAALAGLGSYRLVEFPFSAPGDENGRLDLAVATPTGFAIGEIKPSTPNGQREGLRDLEWYEKAVAAAYPASTVERLRVSIPVGGGLPMPDALAALARCPPQLLGVISFRPGLFEYFCEPPFSIARRTCRCVPGFDRDPEPKRVPVPVPETNPFLVPKSSPLQGPAPTPVPVPDKGGGEVVPFPGKKGDKPPVLTPQTEPIPLAAKSRLRQVVEFLQQLIEAGITSGEKLDSAVRNFLQAHPDLINVVIGAGVVIIIATIAEDFPTLGAGIIDDFVMIPIVARVIVLAREAAAAAALVAGGARLATQ